MSKSHVQVCALFVLGLSAGLISAYPQKIMIKNATNEAITYMLDVRYKGGGMYRAAFLWLEPGEEYDMNEKWFLRLDEMPDEISYLRVAINKKQPKDMQPFSETDASEVKLGKYRAVRIMVRKDRAGNLYSKVNPIHTAKKTYKKAQPCR